jgi:hypothetical protein
MPRAPAQNDVDPHQIWPRPPLTDKAREERLRTRRLVDSWSVAEHAQWMRDRALVRLEVGRPRRALAGLLDDYDIEIQYPYAAHHGPYQATAEQAGKLIERGYWALYREDLEEVRGLIIESTALLLDRKALQLHEQASNMAAIRSHAAGLIAAGKLDEVAEITHRRRHRSSADTYPHPGVDYLFGYRNEAKPLVVAADAEGLRQLIWTYWRPPPGLTRAAWVKGCAITDFRLEVSPERIISRLIEHRRKFAEPFDDHAAADALVKGLHAADEGWFSGWVAEADWLFPAGEGDLEQGPETITDPECQWLGD